MCQSCWTTATDGYLPQSRVFNPQQWTHQSYIGSFWWSKKFIGLGNYHACHTFISSFLSILPGMRPATISLAILKQNPFTSILPAPWGCLQPMQWWALKRWSCQIILSAMIFSEKSSGLVSFSIFSCLFVVIRRYLEHYIYQKLNFLQFEILLFH